MQTHRCPNCPRITGEPGCHCPDCGRLFGPVGLHFGQAFRWLANGYAIRRASWPPANLVSLGASESDPETETIVMRPVGLPWIPFPADLLANDWQRA